MKKTVTDIGNTVICDICNKDWTGKPESGGILLQSKAVCPDCTPGMLKSLKQYNEEHFIKDRCPKDTSFAKWCLQLRGGDNTITVIEFEGNTKLKCVNCGKTPDELDEYKELAEEEECTPGDFVIRNEGTFNRMLNLFCCTNCYIEIGMPLGVANPEWKAN